MKALVIIVTIIGLGAVAGSIIVGRMVFDGKVVEKPYETGLIYDEIERAKSEMELEILNPVFRKGENELLFMIKDRKGNVPEESRIKLTVGRPYTASFDREYMVNLTGPATFRAKVDFPLYGYWDIRVSLTNNQKPVILEKRIFVEGGKEL
ncbi:MAG: FixH family protein [Thermodesulfovibrionales bacterium]|nr:FixH family protein [Thermodesulfovibrionales bacterium]